MREPTKIAGLFGIIGLSTFAFLVLVSLANAQVEVYPDTRPTKIIILSPAVSAGDSAAAEAALRSNVANRLQATSTLGGAQLNVSSDGATVILEGTVMEGADVTEAEAVARATPGVRGVVNRVRVDPMYAGVRPAPMAPAPDSLMAMHVAEALAAHFDDTRIDRDDDGYEVEIDRDGSDDDWEIDVRSYNGGQITLGGSLPSYDAIGRALSVARSVPGVQSVQSNLMLASADYDDDDNDFDGSTHVGPFPKPHFKPFYERDYDNDDDMYD